MPKIDCVVDNMVHTSIHMYKHWVFMLVCMWILTSMYGHYCILHTSIHTWISSCWRCCYSWFAVAKWGGREREVVGLSCFLFICMNNVHNVLVLYIHTNINMYVSVHKSVCIHHLSSFFNFILCFPFFVVFSSLRFFWIFATQRHTHKQTSDRDINR